MDAPQDEGLQLFYQAIVERDMDAWARIHERYRLLLIAWARQSSGRLHVSEQFEDIADRAFVRAWSALTPERFQEFSGLAAILAYLRTCVTSVLLDLARAENARERMLHSLTFSLDASPEEIVLSEMDNAALWRMVSSLVESRQDAAILTLNIVLGLPSRHVLALRPYLFSSVDDVYRAKRNLIGRLKRSRDLQRWLVEYTA